MQIAHPVYTYHIILHRLIDSNHLLFLAQIIQHHKKLCHFYFELFTIDFVANH